MRSLLRTSLLIATCCLGLTGCLAAAAGAGAVGGMAVGSETSNHADHPPATNPPPTAQE